MKRVLIALAALFLAWNLAVIDFMFGANDHLVTVATLVAGVMLLSFIGHKVVKLLMNKPWERKA